MYVIKLKVRGSLKWMSIVYKAGLAYQSRVWMWDVIKNTRVSTSAGHTVHVRLLPGFRNHIRPHLVNKHRELTRANFCLRNSLMSDLSQAFQPKEGTRADMSTLEAILALTFNQFTQRTWTQLFLCRFSQLEENKAPESGVHRSVSFPPPVVPAPLV